MTLFEGLLCLLLLLLLLVIHILFIDFEVRVITNLDEPPGNHLAMADEQMLGKPIAGVEPEVWMESFHLLIVSEWRQTDMIGQTVLTIRPYSAG